jgi:hypothetical protein
MDVRVPLLTRVVARAPARGPWQASNPFLPVCGATTIAAFGLVRLAGCRWLVLICSERKILLAGWWLLTGAELV